MKFGYKEIKEFAENHEDERVRIMYRRLCEARSKSAKWCEEVEKLKEENKQLRLGWCKESEKRMKEWQQTTVGTTGCEICNNAGHVEVTYLHQDGKFSTGWTKCTKCNT